MYDPTIGQFLSEDPLEFEGLDENLRRYVRNRPLTFTDPTGLAPFDDVLQIPLNQLDLRANTVTPPIAPTLELLTVPVVVVDFTAGGSAVQVQDAIDGANRLLAPASIQLSIARTVLAPTLTTPPGRVDFDARTNALSGGGWTGTTISDITTLDATAPSALYVIVVDTIIGTASPTYGFAYVPGNPNGSAIILSINSVQDEASDSPFRTLAHECCNFFGLQDKERLLVDPDNFMSYGMGENGRVIRGTLLERNQLFDLRTGVENFLSENK